MANARDSTTSGPKKIPGNTNRHAGDFAPSHEKNNNPPQFNAKHDNSSGTATADPSAEATAEATRQKNSHSNMHILKKARTELDEALMLCEERLASMEGEFLSRWPGWHLCASLQVNKLP